ncbi:unnamed protein product [Schistosoma rodhaini]|nr:unnamed protein product [Schistosoma rodhaini]
MMKSLQSDNLTSNYHEHFKQNSPVVMKDMCKSKKYMPTTIIAPDGYVPNSPVRVKLIPLGKKNFYSFLILRHRVDFVFLILYILELKPSDSLDLFGDEAVKSDIGSFTNI